MVGATQTSSFLHLHTWSLLFDYQKHGWLTGDVENASKLEEAEERTAWYEPCQEKKGPSAARAKVRVAANK